MIAPSLTKDIGDILFDKSRARLFEFLLAFFDVDVDLDRDQNRDEPIRLDLSGPVQPPAQEVVPSDPPDSERRTGEPATWFALGATLILTALLIYPADAVAHGYRVRPWAMVALIALGIGLFLRLRLAVLIVGLASLAMLAYQGSVVLSWAACRQDSALCEHWQASARATNGLAGSSIVFIFFAALCFWIGRLIYKQWNMLRM